MYESSPDLCLPPFSKCIDVGEICLHTKYVQCRVRLRYANHFLQIYHVSRLSIFQAFFIMHVYFQCVVYMIFSTFQKHSP